MVDSNSDPEGINYVIPGNDDSLRAIELYCNLLADSVIDGLQAEAASSGRDIGEAEEAPAEALAEGEGAEAGAGERTGRRGRGRKASAEAPAAEATEA